MKYKNYYEILGVTRKTPLDEIKLSYRQLAKKYHPDTNKTPEAEEKFKDVNEAYATLTNEEKRKKYDKQVARLGYGFVNTDSSLSNVKYEFKSGINAFNDLLTTILGFKKENSEDEAEIPQTLDSEEKKDKKKAIKGTDIITHLNVTLEEGYFGVEKKIAIKAFKTGLRTFSVKVPVGIKSGDKIRLAALGNPGKNGGKNGDLIINVKLIDDSEFKLDGVDLEKEIEITPAIAALGGKYKLQVMDERLFVSLPKHLRDGEIVTVPNKGYIDENGDRGNLNLKIHIDMPVDITEKEEELYKQLLTLEKRKDNIYL